MAHVARTENDFKVRFLGEDDLAECCRLIAHVFDLETPAVEDWVDKRVRSNPWQSGLEGHGVGIWDEARLVACRLATAQPWVVDGREIVVGFAAHTCSLPEYRGQGLGRLLVEKGRNLAELTGSTSAGVRTQPIYEKTGFQKVGNDNDFFRCRVSFGKSLKKRFGPVGERLVGPLLDLSLKGRLRHGRNFRLFSIQRCSSDFDELWQQARGGYSACLERSSRYLNWRIFDCPTWPLEIAGLYDKKQALRGYGVWHVTEFEGDIRMAVLRDFFVPVDDTEAMNALLALLIRQWRRDGLTWASLEVAHPAITDLFRRCRFEHVPSKGSRYYIAAPESMREEVLARWLRSGLDGDYFDVV